MNDLVDLMDLEEVDNFFLERPRLEDRMDPFRAYDEMEFIRRYRLSKETANFMIQRLQERFEPAADLKGSDIPGHLKFLVALRYMATGNFQISMGDCSDMSQSTVSNCVKAVSSQLTSLTQDYIKFPDIAEHERVKRDFYAIAPLPGVIGCIDCTHIRILSPGGPDAELYRNRHNYYSLNVQAVCDANLKFTNIVCSWPGSVHDSRIFRMSNMCHLLERDHQEGTYSYLLGDSGYPCVKYLLTPILNPTTDQERRYNTAHIRIRNTVERAFGVFKRRFACLSGTVRTELETTKNIIMSCAILHNIAIDNRIPLLDENEPPQNDGAAALWGVGGQPHNEQGQRGNVQQGYNVRASIIQNYF